MVKVKYLPERGTPDETETLNHKFSAKRPTEVTNEAVLAVLRGNPFFEVLDKPSPADAGKLDAPKEDAPKGDGSDQSKSDVLPLIAVEQADGTFAITQGGAQLNHAAISKEEADAFNALTDEDKAEYVK